AIKELRKGETVTSQTQSQEFNALNKYAKNLNELARQGKLDPVIGRDEEIRRTLHILSRRTKNNPILVGEPGVGKTAIEEGLAMRGIKEVSTSEGEIILFIDEIHTLVGAGGGEGAMDAANILKPALARGELR